MELENCCLEDEFIEELNIGLYALEFKSREVYVDRSKFNFVDGEEGDNGDINYYDVNKKWIATHHIWRG